MSSFSIRSISITDLFPHFLRLSLPDILTRQVRHICCIICICIGVQRGGGCPSPSPFWGILLRISQNILNIPSPLSLAPTPFEFLCTPLNGHQYLVTNTGDWSQKERKFTLTGSGRAILLQVSLFLSLYLSLSIYLSFYLLTYLSHDPPTNL